MPTFWRAWLPYSFREEVMRAPCSRAVWSLSLALVCVGSLLSAAEPLAERAKHWHHWRGPDATGVAPNADPPTTWSEKENIQWKVVLPGKGGATPIVWRDQVYILSAVDAKEATETDLPKPDPSYATKTEPPKRFYQFLVQSYDRLTGKLRWSHTAAEAVPHEGLHQTNTYAAGSPTTDGERLYASFGSRGTFCYDLDGKLLWQRDDLGKIYSRLGWGESVTPVIHGDALLLNWDQERDSSLICLDAKTGKTRWRVNREEKTTWNTPLVVEHGGATQVIVNGTTKIRSHNLANGEVLWHTSGMTVNAIPSPVAVDGVVYLLSGYRGAAGVAVSLDARGEVADGQILWNYAKGTPYVPSPLLANGRLYFTQANNNPLTVLDVKTGQALVDRVRLEGVSSIYASPMAAAGKIYLPDRDGTTLVLKLADQLEILATNKLDDVFDASPAAVGKQLFLRGHKALYCIAVP